MSSYPGLTKIELKEMDIIVDSIRNNPTSPKSLGYREQFFIRKQKIAKIRYFFAAVTAQLTPAELDVVKSIIVKPKSSEWSVISRIIQFQNHLTGEQVLEWFECITPANRLSVAISVISDTRFKDVDYKLSLAKDMLKHVNYRRPLLLKLDNLLVDGYEWWDKIFDLVIESINDGTELSTDLLRMWSETKNLDSYAGKKNVLSMPLYEKTGKEQYLPKEAKDIFMF